MSDTVRIPRSLSPSSSDTVRIPRQGQPNGKDTVRIPRSVGAKPAAPPPGATLDDYLQQQKPHVEPPPQ